MMKLARLWAPNRQSREKMTQANAGFAAVASAVRATHHTYLTTSRDPNTIKPLGIDKVTADWIRASYKSAPKYLSLDWITRARNDHELTACPMCGGTAVSTLEHVLPKANYPEFAVLSFNLVPCCDGCQRRRSAKGKAFSFVHPYFDHALLSAIRVAVRFTPDYRKVIFSWTIQGLGGSDLARAQKHLDDSVPPLLFKRHMKALWSTWHLRCFKAGAGTTLVRIQEDLGDAEYFAPNSWDAVFLRGLASDPLALAWMETSAP
jgi:hypothetical protein